MKSWIVRGMIAGAVAAVAAGAVSLGAVPAAYAATPPASSWTGPGGTQVHKSPYLPTRSLPATPPAGVPSTTNTTSPGTGPTAGGSPVSPALHRKLHTGPARLPAKSLGASSLPRRSGTTPADSPGLPATGAPESDQEDGFWITGEIDGGTHAGRGGTRLEMAPVATVTM